MQNDFSYFILFPILKVKSLKWGNLMSKKLIKPMLHILLFCTVFLFAHTYLKNASLTRYLLVTVPILIIGMFGIDIALSLTEKKE